MMKKFLGLMLVCILVLSLSGCFESPTQTPINPDTDQPPTSTEDASTLPLEPENQDATGEPDVTIEETILLDQDGLVITATELVDDSLWGIGLQSRGAVQ